VQQTYIKTKLAISGSDSFFNLWLLNRMSMYKTRLETLSIGKWQVKLNRVTNIDELYDNLIKQDSESEDVIDERIPYWAELWASAIAMSEYIAENEIVNEETFVHEIGCGLALPAIVSGMMGGKVLVSDYMEQPLKVAEENWKLNCKENFQSRIIDWRVLEEDIPKCDLLIAADVAYEKRMFEPLLDVFNKLVKPNGIILFSEPKRKHTQSFYEMLKQKNFSIITTSTSVLMNNFSQGVNVNVIKKL